LFIIDYSLQLEAANECSGINLLGICLNCVSVVCRLLVGICSVLPGSDEQQTVWSLDDNVWLSVGGRQKPEMDVFWICLLIAHIAGRSDEFSSYYSVPDLTAA